MFSLVCKCCDFVGWFLYIDTVLPMCHSDKHVGMTRALVHFWGVDKGFGVPLMYLTVARMAETSHVYQRLINATTLHYGPHDRIWFPRSCMLGGWLIHWAVFTSLSAMTRLYRDCMHGRNYWSPTIRDTGPRSMRERTPTTWLTWRYASISPSLTMPLFIHYWHENVLERNLNILWT